MLPPPVTHIYGTVPFFASVPLQVILHVRLLSLKCDIYDKGATSRRSGLLYHLSAAKSQEQRQRGVRLDGKRPSPCHPVPNSNHSRVNGGRDGRQPWLIGMQSTSVSSGGARPKMNRQAGRGVSVPGGLLFPGLLLSPFSRRIAALSRQRWLMQTSGIVKLFQVCWELM